ncbi:MAG: argininosuccinate lyase [Oscillospiraceae bacterium]|nr:argininosuccinate lyase [Oscillospiraceae bacterium]
MGKLWEGNLHSQLDSFADDFNSSIRFDSRMAQEDIRGSMAHAAMLGAKGIISKQDAEEILAGLEGILSDLASGALTVDPAAEDIHSFVEAELTARVGDAGKRLHTARSRNDQVALDLRMYLRGQTDEIVSLTAALLRTVKDKALEHAETIMPGYTHLQRGQPIVFGHLLMAYAMMFTRDIERFRDAAARMNRSPLGSGALAGTTYPIDREATAAALGFDGPTLNSIDGVSDRDFCLELCAAAAILMMHLSRFAEEIILWSSWEFRFVELSDAYTTGSSIMPQKKNSDMAELCRGKTGRVYGDLMALLTVMKGLPLAYNKDMQEDKEAVFDSMDTVRACLQVFEPMVRTMTVRADNMRKAAAEGFINATDLADYMAKKGLPFRDAYRVTGDLVALCIEKGVTLEELSLEEYRRACPLLDEALFEEIRLETCVARRVSMGGTAPESVRAQAAAVEEFLSDVSDIH